MEEELIYVSKRYVDRPHHTMYLADENFGILKRIHSAKKIIKTSTIISYGDTLANINIIDLYNFHNNNNAIGTVSSYQIQSQFGILNIDKNGLVNDFMEKPKLDAWINIGFFIFNKKKCKSINCGGRNNNRQIYFRMRKIS